MERSKRVLARMTLGALRHLHARGRLMEGVLWQVGAGRLGAGQLGAARSPCCSSGWCSLWLLPLSLLLVAASVGSQQRACSIIADCLGHAFAADVELSRSCFITVLQLNALAFEPWLSCTAQLVHPELPGEERRGGGGPGAAGGAEVGAGESSELGCWGGIGTGVLGRH